MKTCFTVPTPAKIKWLISTPTFKRRPFKTLLRVIRWEVLRLLHSPTGFAFDGSLRLKLYPDDGVARLTYYFDYHEPEAFAFLERCLQPGMTFLDIGANIGVYSLFASKRVGPLGRVVAFEPNTTSFARFTENIIGNQITNIIAEPFALGSKDAYLEIVCYRDSSRNHIRIIHSHDNPNLEHSAIHSCKCISLDNYLSEHGIQRLDYLKIDVEGFEFEVLQGAVETLKSFNPPIVQLELIDDFQKHNGSTSTMVCNFLYSYNYRPYELVPQSLKLSAVDGSKIRDGNYIFLHESKYSEFADLISA